MTQNYQFEDILALNEMNLLKCKLETKSQVLKSISKELIICKKEKDEYKLMAEQLGEKCTLMKRKIERLNSHQGQNQIDTNFECLDDYNQLLLNQNYKKLQDANKFLNLELNDLRIKLADAESDIRLLREKNAKVQKRNHSENIIDNISGNDSKTNCHLIQQIEKLKMKNKQFEKDLKLYLDEKEDLIKSRNNYIQKAKRLNENLNALMKSEYNSESDPNKSKRSDISSTDQFFDIDSILLENKFLKDKLECLEQDRKYSKEMIAKYKHALHKTNSNKKNFFEFPNLTSKSNKTNNKLDCINQDIISTKEIQFFITSNNLNTLEHDELTLNKLRKLLLLLFESLTDKSTALNLARANNKLLGNRINDLEKKLKEYEIKEKNNRIETFRMKFSNTSQSNDVKINDFIREFQSDLMNSNDNLHKESVDVNKNLTRRSECDATELPNNLQILVQQELEKLKDE